MMRHRLLISLALFLFIPQHLQAQWVQTNIGSSGLVSCMADSGMNLYAGTNDGLYVSTNHGGSWTSKTNGLSGAFVISLAVSATSQFAGTDGDGVYLSTNNGTSWKAISTGLTARVVHSFAVSGTNTFASIDSSVYLTPNDGITWKHLASFPSIAKTLSIVGNNLVAGTANGVFLSTNDGISWKAASSGLKDTNILSFTVRDTDIFAGTDSGSVYLSTNQGNSWAEMSSGLTKAPVRALAASGPNIFAATSAGVFFSTNNGVKWKTFNTGLPNLEDLSLTTSGSYLLVGTTSSSGVYRRPLSDVVLFDVQAPLQSRNSIACYPNPVIGTTAIQLSISVRESVVVSVVNLLGVEVSRLFFGELDAGQHVFNWDARGLPSGMYQCILSMNGRSEHLPILMAR